MYSKHVERERAGQHCTAEWATHVQREQLVMWSSEELTAGKSSQEISDSENKADGGIHLTSSWSHIHQNSNILKENTTIVQK